MKTHIALLRGVNVGGNRKVAMAELRGLVEGLGFGDVRTLLNSGNLVFRSDGRRTDGALAELLETEAAGRLGLRTWFLVRSAAEWAEVVARNPFPEEATAMPSRFLVMFFRETPGEDVAGMLRAGAVGSERVAVDGREVYAVFPDGIVDSRMANALIGARFAKLATGRNWNTVRKLGALAGGLS